MKIRIIIILLFIVIMQTLSAKAGCDLDVILTSPVDATLDVSKNDFLKWNCTPSWYGEDCSKYEFQLDLVLVDII